MGRKARDKKPCPAPQAAAEAEDVAGTPREVVATPRSATPRTATPRDAAPRSEASVARESGARVARNAIWAIALTVATAAAYAGALDAPFLLDDPINITKNPDIELPLQFGTLLLDPRATVTATLRWNYLQGGFDVGAYHVLNVCAHAITGLLVFALAQATLRLDVFGGRYRRHAADLAGVIALIFLLHPMQTESVTYVIQRAEIFAAAGLVGALLALVSMPRGVTWPSMAALAAACVFGLYSKPSFAVVPALMLAYDGFLLSRGKVTAAVARRWPAYALAGVAAVATFALTKWSGDLDGNSTAGFDIEGITPLSYLSAQFGVIVLYLGRALWPGDLCFDCGYRGPWPVLTTMLGDSVLLPLAILVAIAVASLAFARRQPLLPWAVFGSALVLAPTSSVVPLADFYVEHRMYLPIALLAMVIVPAAYDAASATSSLATSSSTGSSSTGSSSTGSSSTGLRLAAPTIAFRATCVAAAAIVVAMLALSTVRRNELLSDPLALMEDSLAQAPQNERVHYNLANAYKRLGRLDDAIPHYEAAIRLLPNVIRSYQNLGSVYLEQGKVEDALRVYLAGAEAKPGVAMGQRNVASAYLKLGRAEEALAAAERSLAIEASNPNGRRLAGDALAALGRDEEAAVHWRAGMAASPGDATFRERLAKLGQR